MNKKKNYKWSMLLLAAIALLTYYLLMREYSLRDTLDAIGRADVRILLAGLLLPLIYLLGEAEGIRRSVTTFGYRARFGPCLKYSVIGHYYSSITPFATGGQPVQMYYMDADGIPVAVSGMTFMLIAVMFKANLLIFGLLLVALKAELIFTGIPYFNVLFAVGLVFSVGMMILLLTAMFSKSLVFRIAEWVINMGAKLRLIKDSTKTHNKIKRQIKEYNRAAKHLKSNPKLALRIFLTVMVQRAAMFSVAFAVYKALGLQGLSWTDILAIQMATAIACDTLPLPGAVGAAEGIFLSLYGRVYGDELIAPALLLTRGINYYLPMLLCGLLAGYFHVAHIKKNNA